nr:protein UL49 [Mastomys natalensis cytomegalovirus 3]WEG69885.1 protein UL49 [Mastomys natalensis cytomegalovirus 3]WEG70025.1 protein UL49 [Mastomys natalensis cytomegalovirus 3]WEG70165.1 protein UL49 [Mastomys natalensis cytomegalovirus 3]WEG70305.1 protein UL49 [Mastomys natalensis cytomegalovirus 3]
MRPVRKIVRELFSGVCQHRERYHIQLLLSGTAEEEHDGRRIYCVLNMFISGKKFLCKDVVDELYCRFLERWSTCSQSVKSIVCEMCQRESMTRHMFIVLSYFYVVRCMEHVAKNVSCLYLRIGMSNMLERAFVKYSRQKMDALIENVTFQGLNDLHQFVFSFPFAIPIPNQTSSPCIAFLRAREYETGCDVPVFHKKRTFRGDIVDTNVSVLVEILRSRCQEVPCGNPFYVMAKVIVEQYCRSVSRFLIPLGNKTLRYSTRMSAKNIEMDGPRQLTVSKMATFATSVVLRNGLISSLIDLPVWCYCKTKCQRYDEGGVLEAILCNNCGHCLNLGKDKLEGNHTFALNCIFYYRDRQEKSVIYSTHNGTAHCSLCGNQYLSRERIYEVNIAESAETRIINVRWRAVIGSNAACGVLGPGTRLDVLVPCSARTCFGTVVLRDVSVDKLLRLTSHSAEFVCQTCPSSLRETCLDQVQSSTVCVGCKLYSQFCCAELRRRNVE